MPSNELPPGHGAGWLNIAHDDDEKAAHARPEDIPTEPISPIAASDPVSDRTGAQRNGFRIRTRTALFVISAVGILAGTLAGLGVAMMSTTSPSTTPTLTSASTTTPNPTTPHPVRACTGLKAATVTDGAGDTTTVAGVIAKFQHAYYVQRDVDAALALAGPQSGVTREGLTPVIAALPGGVTHCVGIDVIAENTAEVHVVELRADGARSDYLQLVNVDTGPSGLVIANIQKRGN